MSKYFLLIFCYILCLACQNPQILAGRQARHFSSREVFSKLYPSPESILGFVPGTSRTIADWSQITNYFQKLGKVSSQVSLKTLGKTSEGRTLFAVFISSAQNIKNLKKIIYIQKLLADPRLIKNSKQREYLLKEGKIFIGVSCSLHSTEIVASQMSMQLAYNLAANKENTEILKNIVIVLLPSPNPDGIDVIANWYRQTLNTPFEGSSPPFLYHHYAGHDNNRDWYMLTQLETQLITKLFYQECFPQIIFDLHQSGSYGARVTLPPFYGPPNPNIPALILRQTSVIGEQLATDLTANGFKGILTSAQYNTWWPGGLRTISYYHNAIGLLSEVASTRLMTPLQISSNQLIGNSQGFKNPLERKENFPEPWLGGMWSPENITSIELIACHSLFSYGALYRRQILENYLSLGEYEILTGATTLPFAYGISPDQFDREAMSRLINLLLIQGIEVKVTKQSFSFNGKRYPAGCFIIPMAQPYRAWIKTLFEVQQYPASKNNLNLDEFPYDITGWTLPLLTGVDVFEIISPLENINIEKLTELLSSKIDWTGSTILKSSEDSESKLGIYKSAIPNEDEGWTRWILDLYKIPYRVMNDQDVHSSEILEKLSVLILPDQSSPNILSGWNEVEYPLNYTGGMGSVGLENLKKFVTQGGKLVCLGRSSTFVANCFNLPVQNVLEDKSIFEFYCPGSILGIEVNTDSFIGHNSQKKSSIFFFEGGAFETSDKSVQVLARYAKKNVLSSGFLIGEEFIAGRIALLKIKKEKGEVVLFGFRPQFRGQTNATFQLFLNSLNF